MQDYKKIDYTKNKDVVLRYIPGHFVTPNSHVNYYMDLCDTKARMKEARATGEALAEMYLASDVIDTILCLNGMEVVGAYMGDKLTQAGIISLNSHKTMYITQPEYNVNGQMMFRDNKQRMVKGMRALLLTDSITSGKTILQAIDSVLYYGGTVCAISAVFSAVNKCAGLDVNSIFTARDIPSYAAYKRENCVMCAQGQRLEALVNGFGYSKL